MSVLQAVLASLTLVLLALYALVVRKRMNYFKDLGFLHVPPWPFLGNMGPSMLRRKHLSEVIREAYNLHPDAKYVGFYDFQNPVIVVRDPELIKSIAVKNFEHFTDHRGFIDEVSDPLFGKNLFSIRGDRWRDVRNLLSPAFTSSKMKAMFDLMFQCAERFVDFLARESAGKENVLQVKNIFTRYTNDVIATCAFGISVDSMRNPKNEFYVLGREATNLEGILGVKMFTWRALPTVMKFLGVKIVTDKVGRFFKDIVRDTVAYRDENGITRPDMLQLMMDNRGKADKKFDLDIEEMTAQAFIFFFGGFDTTSTLMCFMAHELALNPAIQAKLRAEIDEVLERKGGTVTYEDINEMPYLDAVTNESNRRYSQVIFLDRLCVKRFQLPPALPGMKPFLVEPGMNIWFPSHAIHLDPRYYEDPLEFDPDRFLHKKVNTSQATFLSFGMGPRMCIGNRFALLETKVLFFHLLAKCNLKPCAKTNISRPLEVSKSISLSFVPKGGFWLNIEARQNVL